jgi:hypothetical protein
MESNILNQFKPSNRSVMLLYNVKLGTPTFSSIRSSSFLGSGFCFISFFNFVVTELFSSCFLIYFILSQAPTIPSASPQRIVLGAKLGHLQLLVRVTHERLPARALGPSNLLHDAIEL